MDDDGIEEHTRIKANKFGCVHEVVWKKWSRNEEAHLVKSLPSTL